MGWTAQVSFHQCLPLESKVTHLNVIHQAAQAPDAGAVGLPLSLYLHGGECTLVVWALLSLCRIKPSEAEEAVFLSGLRKTVLSYSCKSRLFYRKWGKVSYLLFVPQKCYPCFQNLLTWWTQGMSEQPGWFDTLHQCVRLCAPMWSFSMPELAICCYF